MRGRSIVGMMVLLAACATGRGGAEPEAPDAAGVVRESQLDRPLTTLCYQGATTRVVNIPVQIVVRPDGRVATARANGDLGWFYGDRSELRVREQSLRAQAESRATTCRFSEPTVGGEPVHARVVRTMTLTY